MGQEGRSGQVVAVGEENGLTPRLGRLNGDIGISLCREIPTYLAGLNPLALFGKRQRLGWY